MAIEINTTQTEAELAGDILDPQNRAGGANLIEIIAREMASDDADPHRQSAKLIAYVQTLDAAGRNVVDNVLMYLTGYELTTLIEKTEEG